MRTPWLLQLLLLALHAGPSSQDLPQGTRLTFLQARQRHLSVLVFHQTAVNANQSRSLSRVQSRLDNSQSKADERGDALRTQASTIQQLTSQGEIFKASVARLLKATRLQDIAAVQREESFRDCADVLASEGHPVSGLRRIYPEGEGDGVTVFCDQDTEGGGWTVIQRRKDGKENFYRDFVDYENGFGDPAGEYWLGLKHVHSLTSRGVPYELQVLLDTYSYRPGVATANYSHFSVGERGDNYRLSFFDFTGGAAGDGLRHNKGRQFTTRDAKHDNNPTVNCAVDRSHSAWWYSEDCGESDLNGVMKNYSTYRDTEGAFKGIYWKPYQDMASLMDTQMKIRPMTIA